MTVMKKFAIYFLRRGICDDMYWKKSITVQTYTISAMLEIMTFVFFSKVPIKENKSAIYDKTIRYLTIFRA